ncbi:MAG: SIMPL domain-containing protein [Candidatus Kerfeldbacteria bacterium]|nr:SIMPL domain-containing protein [Candidatus Kerfeldbacteria bacterium]
MDYPTLSSLPSWLKTTVVAILGLWLAFLGLDRAFQAGISWQNLNHWQRPISTNDTIAVTAEGKVTAIPDVGLISLAVESRGLKVNDIQANNTRKINDIMTYLKGLGVDKKDLRTTQYNLAPVYSYDPKTGKQNLDGYSLNQTVEVKIRQLDKVGDVLAGSLERGANQVGQLSFTIDDPDKLQQEARLQAIAKARAKAEDLARAAGVTLGKVRSFSENVSSPAPYPMYYARDMMLGAESKAQAPQIEAGSQDVIVNVSLSFEID